MIRNRKSSYNTTVNVYFKMEMLNTIGEGVSTELVISSKNPSLTILWTRFAVFWASIMPECSRPLKGSPSSASAPFSPCGLR